MGVTQQRIAAEAGVSATTVSFVLGGRAEEMKISAACAERVRATARQLGYRVNHHARALASGRAMTLGFANTSRLPNHHQFGLLLSSGVERRARERGYDLLLFGPGTGEYEITHALAGLVEKRVDALLLPFFPGTAITRDLAQRWPLVLIAARPGHGYPAVNLDPAPGIREAVRHLADLGHRRILWLGVRANANGQAPQRTEAFHSAAEAAGVRHDAWFMPGTRRPEPSLEEQIAGYREALRRELPLAPGTTAVMCYNDTVALALYAVLAERGLRIPDDVSVVGFDDFYAACAVPALTTVSHMLPEIGARAVDLAIDILVAGRPYPYEIEVTVPARLVVRASTGPARGVEAKCRQRAVVIS